MGGYRYFFPLIRFIAFIPFFIFSPQALGDWKELRKHEMPPGVPWAHNLHIGLGIAGVGVSAISLW